MPGLRAERPRPTCMMASTVLRAPPGSRTVEVLYLLSRRSKLEHPHMINVHYAAHQPGPTLNDLKARLIALRGKGMPDSFAWSYKRNYKDTFIWCDLFNDDLILPLSESGEYVLKATKLYDAVSQDGELEYGEEVWPSLLPVQSSSPRKTSTSRLSSRPEHRDVEGHDSSVDIKESIVLGTTVAQAADITGESRMDLRKQMMSYPAAEVCEVSSSGTVPSLEGQSKSQQSRSKSSGGTTFSTPSPSLGANQEHQCNPDDFQTSHRELASKDVAVATDSVNLEFATITPSPMRTPGSGVCARRRSSFEKEIDTSTMCTQTFVYHRNGSDVRGSSALEAAASSGSSLCVSNPEDPFLFGVLRKATRLGSNFRPRLCRGVDVVDSTRIKTKLHGRRTSSANGECDRVMKHQASRSVVISAELSSEMKSERGDSVTRSSNDCFISPEKPIRGLPTLHEYSDTNERISSNSPTPVDKLINEPPSVDDSDHAQLGLAEQDVSDLPQDAHFGNESSRLDFSCKKTMESLAKPPGTCRVRTMPQREDHKSVRSESKGDKQEVKSTRPGSDSRQAGPKPSYEHNGLLHRSCTVHELDDPVVVRIPEERPRNVMASRQRRPMVKKAPVVSLDASSVRCGSLHTSVTRVKAGTGKLGSDEKTMKASRIGSKESASKVPVTTMEDQSTSRPEIFSFDSRAMRSGNKQGLKNMATQVVPATSKIEAKAAAEATSRTSSIEGPKRWPFEPPSRPRDFKSREDRPLVPGLSSKDWERSFQEAFRHSEPPTNLVLHECSQCGRTFKLESLQVHLRGCRAVNKPKPSSATHRRLSI